MAIDFTKKLKGANALWKAAKERAATARSSQFAEFEDGRYMARLITGTVGESQSSGRLQIQWAFKFAEGEYEGQEKLDFSGLETETNLEYLARRFAQLGYEAPDDLVEIQDVLDDIKKTQPLCKIRLKTKGEFQNVFIDKVFAGGNEEGGEEVEGDAPEPEPEPAPPVKKGKAKAAPVVEEPAEEEEPAPAEEEEEEETPAEEENVDLTVGMTVIADTSKGKMKGEVIEILEAEGKVRVQVEGGKVLRVAVDKLEAIEEPPPEPKVVPKKIVKGKK